MIPLVKNTTLRIWRFNCFKNKSDKRLDLRDYKLHAIKSGSNLEIIPNIIPM